MQSPLFLLALLLLAGVTPATAATAEPPADLIFYGRHILPMAADKPTGQRGLRAVAVRGERIVYVGRADRLRKEQAHLIGPDTEAIELGRQALLPGFIDAHGHLTFQAFTIDLANVAPPPVGPVSTIADLQDTLRSYIAERAVQPGDWISGNGYDDSLLAEGRHPTRRDLDAVSTEHPIALMHISGHLMTANSRALALAGITADSADPQGGLIRRWPDSEEPNGVLEETATYPLRPFLFGTQQNVMDNLRRALELYASYGITTIQDGATAPESIELIRAAADAGLLQQDVIFYPVQNAIAPIPEAWALGRYGKRAKAGGIKLVLDGSPQGKTAYLSAPYEVPPDGQDADYRGYPIHPPAKVSALVDHYLRLGVPILAHANGDAAAELLVNAVADTEHERDHRTVMIHAQTVREDQLQRMAELGIIPSFFSAHTFFWGDWHRDSVLGLERASRISPTATARRLGLNYTVHNDAPIVPPDMLRLLWATSSRITRSGAVLGAAERATVYDALLAITRNAAAQAFEEADKGTLAVGKLADLVVLSRNPLRVPRKRLLELTIVSTWSHGRQIYGNVAE
ncbi:MAG: amidohydrolase [Pseudomonadota bacterium]